jgi:adenine nucleotide transporter 17
VEGKAALEELEAEAEAGEQEEKSDAQRTRTAPPAGFWRQALAIVRAKKLGVYQGHVSTQVALGGSNFVYFFCYNGLKSALLKRMARAGQSPASGAISPAQNLVLSCLAGVINVYVCAPLWVANMRLKSKDHTKYAGVWDCLRKVTASEGLLSLWNGTLASLMLVSNPVIHYVSYERMKLALQHKRLAENPKARGALTAMEIFVLGALAKSLTTVVTYPLQVAQSLMRVQEASNAKKLAANVSSTSPSPAPPKAQSLSDCLAQIYRDNGVRGYFAGIEAKLLQTVLTAAISLVTYEKLLAIILVLLRQNSRKALVEKAAA